MDPTLDVSGTIGASMAEEVARQSRSLEWGHWVLAIENSPLRSSSANAAAPWLFM
jgi:hypothetical protein